MMERDGLDGHGEFGGAVFVFAVVGEDEVLEFHEEFFGELRDFADFVFDDEHAEDDVAEEFAGVGVFEAGVAAEFADFADVVEDDAGEEGVSVELGVCGDDFFGEVEEGDRVFQQAADVCVVVADARG